MEPYVRKAFVYQEKEEEEDEHLEK